MPRRPRRAVALAGLALAVGALSAAFAPGLAAADEQADVQTAAEPADAKLSDRLEELSAGPPQRQVHVIVTVSGSTAAVSGVLQDPHVASVGKTSLVVGTLPAGRLDKLATTAGVVHANAVENRRTGKPVADPETGVSRRPTLAQLKARAEARRANDKGWQGDDGLADSNFDAVRRLNVLDARTHRFTGAWNRGYTGEGSTVAVLDGGTDFGHPDLIGTWATGANGWPAAYDPYGTLQWLLFPGDIAQGLSWYVITEAHAITRQGRQASVTFGVRTGPSRNFAAPSGTVEHAFTFPARWTKSGTVRLASHPDDYLLQTYGERAAVLVTDPHTAGVYDTVYVDLDGDHSFADEKPVSKDSPASYRDTNGDGYTDLSGGLLYYISDGLDGAPVPGGLELFGEAVTGEPGEILAWSGDFDPGIEGHGTLTASNVVGQGVINGLAPRFADLPNGGRYPGAVVGGAPDAKLLPYGDIYFAFEASTQLGYILGYSAGVDVMSNSYGDDGLDNDGFDALSQEADLWADTFGHSALSLGSTGNGAPGFGTTNAPSPSSGMSVGASTQFGGTGWDSIKNYSQVVDNDVMVWSDRGPGATGAGGVDIVADGAYSPGDVTLNAVGDGRTAWESWGGTSRSTPVAAGAAALVYQAWRKAHAGASPDAFDVRSTLMSAARDLNTEPWIQGAGSLDATRAVDVALGKGGRVLPDSWRPGSYAGQQWDVFPHLLAPGQSAEQEFTIEGGSTATISDRYLVRTDTVTKALTTSPIGNESAYSFNAPDYLVDITKLVKEHPGADLMVIKANFDHSQLDVDGDYAEDQAWRLLTYSWTDIDHDGRLWRDRDRDGVVDHVQLDTSSNIDGNPDIDFGRSEIDKGEYVRFMYHRAGTNALTNFVRKPNDRVKDGIFIGLQHSARSDAIPQTAISFEIEFYDQRDWPWLTTSKTANGTFTARMSVPANAPYGMYNGAITVRDAGGRTSIVPVSLTVGATAQQADDGALLGTTTFGGAGVAASQANRLYNNGSVFGAHDWTWRRESGDWRFFYLDVPKAPPPGTLFLANTTWDDAAPHTDLDTVILGPSANTYQWLDGSDPFGAPYILDVVGKSEDRNVGAGVWQFGTATGGNEEVVTAPAQQGLHAFLEHQVLWQGGKFHTPFQLTVGAVNVAPSAVQQTVAADAGSFDIAFNSSIDLPAGIVAKGYGLSQPQSLPITAQQDNPDDPGTSSVKQSFTVAGASRATITVDAGSNDVDLFILRDANGDGTFSFPAEVAGASATASGFEQVTFVLPADGNYQAWVHGFGVPSPVATTLDLDIVQGADLTVTAPTGPIAAGAPVTIHAEWAKALTPGQTYAGEILLGPASAPTAITIPVSITRS